MIANLAAILESTELVQTIGWTLFHFLWQGLLVGLTGGLLLAALSRHSANLRYWTACTALLVMAACPVVTFFWLQGDDGNAVVATNDAMPIPTVEMDLQDPNDHAPFFAVNETQPEPMAHDPASVPLEDAVTTEQEPVATLVAPVDWKQRIQQGLVPALPWMVIVWLGGVLALSLRMLISWVQVQKIKATGSLFDDDRILDMFRNLGERLGLADKARLLQSTAVAVPTVIGWFKPVVLMPASVLTGLSPQQLEAVMAHELAHIRRADYLINMIQTLIETILFYHPAVWWLSARIRSERENCCDDLATQVCGNPKEYAEALLKLEQLKPSTPALAMGADGSSLVHRVARLVGKQNSRSGRRFWLAGLGSLVIALCVLGMVVSEHTADASDLATGAELMDNGVGTEEKEQEDKQDQDKSIKVLVLDENGNPLQDAHIHAGIWTSDRSFAPNQMGDTDADGIVTIKMPNELEILRLWASAEGYTRLFSSWEEQEIKSGDVPPVEYTFRMIKGTEIGGVIRNEAGEPIAGAKVGVSASATHPDGQRRPRFGSWYAIASGSGGDTRIITDDQGRWSLGTLPPVDDLKVTVSVSHPDYIDDPRGELAKAQAVTTAQLRDQSATIVMQHGVVVSGSLKDPNGDPVTEGLVIWGDVPYGTPGSQEVKINLDGTYELPPLPPGKQRITVVARDFRPETRMIEIEKMMSDVDFEMVNGSTISIRLEDAKTGEPLKGFVGINGWRGVSSLYNNQHPSVMDSGVPFRTNDVGVYQWTWAPDDEVQYQIEALGYTPRMRVPLTASTETHVVKLYKPLEIAGSVFDKVSGDRIDTFAVVPLRYSDPEKRPNKFHERTSELEKGKNGRFRISPFLEGSYRFKIQAPGYKPFVTEMYKTGDDVPRLKVELEKAAWRQGRVVDEAGEGVSEANILVASKSQVLTLRNYGDGRRPGPRGKTDEQGNFTFPQSDEPCTYVVLHKKGYAEVVRHPGEDIGELTLRPWVSVEGIVYDESGKPAPGVKVGFEATRFQYDHIYHFQDLAVVQTDNDGRYRFPRLPPIVGVIRPLSHMTELLRNEPVVPVDLGSASEHQVNIGNGGTEVTGTLVLVGNELSSVDYSPTRSTVLPVAAPRFGFPEMLKSADWRNGWNEVQRIQALHPYWPARSYLYSLGYTQVQPMANGKFTVRVDKPGTFEMGINLKVRATELGGGVFAAANGKGTFRFEVDQAAFDSGQVDLGTIEVAAYPGLAVGDAVPNFGFRYQDDQVGQVADYRGEYVLLDFWAAWCETCDEDKQKLVQLANVLKDAKSKMRMLSVENPGSGNYTRAPGSTKDVWRAGKIIYKDNTPSVEYESLFQSLGISALPCYLIVDPDGKLVYHGQIDGAIEKMMEIK